jgi:hypothetical protein
MPYQVHLKCKNGRIRTDLGVVHQQTPQIGQEIDYPVDNGAVRAKVSSVNRGWVGAAIGQPIDLVKADEL